MSTSLPEEDLSCPVCCEIFQDPVLLPCSHSFCRRCLEHFWESALFRSCPVCRRRASKKSPLSNRALKNLCEAFLLGKGQGNGSKLCWRHGEKLKLFCLVDQEPICVVCQASKMHKGHDCTPTEEAALDCKDKLSAAMKGLQEKLEVFNKARQSSAFTLEHIKNQALRVESQMKDEFLKLHQYLYEEEEHRLSALKEEEEQRVTAVKDRDEENTRKISALTEIFRTMEQTINAEDLTLLQNFKATIDGTCSTFQDPECLSGSLLDESKYIGNLKYKVWEKMQGVAPYSPVILDPNTAHPCLTLSDDLTSLQYHTPKQGLPSNPERFHMSAEVLGCTAFNSLSHSWEIEVGDNEDWIVGLASEHVKKDQEVPARPENGFWTVCFRDGQYRAMTSPPTALKVEDKLQKLLVQLNWDKGEIFQSLSAPPESTAISFSSLMSFDDMRESFCQLKVKLEDFCKEEIKKIPDRVTFINSVPKTRIDFLQYSHQLNLDLNTVNKLLCLSERNRVISYAHTVQHPKHPDKFDVWPQVLCKECVCVDVVTGRLSGVGVW